MERHEVSDNYYIHKNKERNEVCRSKCFLVWGSMWQHDCKCLQMRTVNITSTRIYYYLDNWQLLLLSPSLQMMSDRGSRVTTRTALVYYLFYPSKNISFILNIFRLLFNNLEKLKVVILNYSITYQPQGNQKRQNYFLTWLYEATKYWKLHKTHFYCFRRFPVLVIILTAVKFWSILNSE